VGQRFATTVGRINLSPSGCNRGFDSPESTYRSSQPSVVTVAQPGLFDGIAPGTAMIMLDNLRLPSGRTETVQLTVCAEATAPEATCTTRVPLVIRVLP
jgi:hypothetical protein